MLAHHHHYDAHVNAAHQLQLQAKPSVKKPRLQPSPKQAVGQKQLLLPASTACLELAGVRRSKAAAAATSPNTSPGWLHACIQ